MSTERPSLSLIGTLIALYAVGGVLLLCGQAVVKLTPIALDPIRDGTMNALHWVVFALWVVINAYAEGYRGFQKRFSPRVVARAVALGRDPKLLFALLAPMYAMAMFHARRRSIIVAWCLLFGIVGLVLIVRSLPQPWRGIIDAGVVIGLAWGMLSIVVIFARALFTGVVPEDDAKLEEQTA